MMRFLRKGDRYVLNKPLIKYSDPSFYGFQCLLLSLSTYYHQFSCNVQESRASGTTGYAARLIAALVHVIQVLRTVYTHKRINVDTSLTHERHNNHTCLTHEPHMNDTTNCGKEVGIGNQQAGSKLSRSMHSVSSFNTLLIHCYYFTHTWLILRPYTKSASTRVASWLGIASRLGRTLVHTCSTVVRVLFECCSSATRTTLEAHPKSTRSRVEEVSNTTRRRLEGQSKPTRTVVEALSKDNRSITVKKEKQSYLAKTIKWLSEGKSLANRLSRFAGNYGKVLNDLHMNRLILRCFRSVWEEVRVKVVHVLVENKRSSQNGLNEVNGFSIFGTSGDSDMGGALATKERLRQDVRSDGSKGTDGVGIKRGYSRDIVLFVQQLRRMLGFLKEYFKGAMESLRYYVGNNSRISRLGLLTIFCVLFSFASVVEAQAQELRQGGATSQAAIKPLRIGDTIPEEVWNMPLQVVEYGGKTKEIRLADYRGKVIILDYWATWCVGCILSMPKMHELAEEMSRDVALLAVTRQDEQVVSRYLAITASKQMLQLRDSFSTIVSGDIMSDLIPHRSLPHIAIINKYGVLEQTTLPHLLNASILQAISAGGDYYLPINRSDVDTTLLSQTFPDIRHDKPIYYSTLMGYVDGFSAPSKHIVDSSANITRGYFINTSILRLMNIALQSRGIGLLPNRRIMLVDNPSDFDYFHERNPNYQRREFTVSYEYALPITWSREKINNRILSDIQDYRGLYVKMIRREVPCLVLKKKKGTAISEVQKGESSGEVINGVLAFSREQREVGLSSSGAKNYLRGVSIGALESILNNLKTGAVPFVINETGIDYNINLDLPDDLNDVGSLTEILEKQGILVVQERRELDIFVMHDKPIILHKVQSAELELTKFGYVLQKEVDNG